MAFVDFRVEALVRERAIPAADMEVALNREIVPALLKLRASFHAVLEELDANGAGGGSGGWKRHFLTMGG
jgi:hypothetical protein